MLLEYGHYPSKSSIELVSELIRYQQSPTDPSVVVSQTKVEPVSAVVSLTTNVRDGMDD